MNTLRLHAAAAHANGTVGATGASGANGANTTNLAAIGMLRWYNTLISYSVGTQAVALAFDGTNIWVGSANSGSVQKLLALTGGTVGTYNVLPTGIASVGLAFDGTNIRAANGHTSDMVSQLSVSTGGTLNLFTVGMNPVAVAFDGTSMWVANQGGNTVTRITFPGQ